jgi:hypothetical protein
MENKLFELKLWLRVTIDPRTWMRIRLFTNRAWDSAVRATLAAGHKPKKLRDNVILLNGMQLWWPNGYFAAGSPHNTGATEEVEKILPSRRTVFLVNKLLREVEVVNLEENITGLCTRLVMGPKDKPKSGVQFGTTGHVTDPYRLTDPSRYLTAPVTKTGIATTWEIKDNTGTVLSHGTLDGQALLVGDNASLDFTDTRIT